MGEECGTDGRKKECIAGFSGETCRRWTASKKWELWTGNIELGVKNRNVS